MIRNKPSGSNAYVQKIADLKSQLDSVAKELSEAIGQRDLAISGKKNAEIEHRSILAKITSAQGKFEVIQQDLKKVQEQYTAEIKKKNEKRGQVGKEVNSLEVALAGLKREISDTQNYLNSYEPKAKELKEVEKQLALGKSNLVKLTDQVDAQEKVLTEKKQREKIELEKLLIKKAENEEVLAKIEKNKAFVERAVTRISNYCAKHNIPFDFSKIIAVDEETKE